MIDPASEGLVDEAKAAAAPDGFRRDERQLDLTRVLDYAGDGVTVQDGNFRIIFQNRIMRELYGDHCGDLCYQAYQQRDEMCENCPVTGCLDDGVSRVHERRVTVGGKTTVVEVVASPVPDEKGRFIACVEIVRDITERKRAELTFRRTSAMYEALSRTNKAIMYIGDRQSLLQEVCRLTVEFAGFSLAVMVMLEEESGLLRPLYYSGKAQQYLASLVISADASVKEGRGPTGIAIRENRSYICNDFSTDPVTDCWREAAAANGIRSAAAFPLSEKGRVTGALKFYADDTDFFNPEMVALLEELAANVSFSLDNLRLQEEKERIEAEWRESQEHLHSVMEASHLGVWEWEVREGNFTFSPDFVRLLGYDPEEVAGDAGMLYNLIHPEDGARAKRSLQEIFNRRSEEFSVQMRVLKKSKEWEWILCQGKVVSREAGKAVRVAGIASCITDQKKYQEKLEFESTHDGMTGLYNRAYFDRKLAEISEGGKPVPVSLVVIDLDGLKEVNDTWGHGEGDRLICLAAQVLQQCFRSGDIIARVGGDEFAVILPATNSQVLEEAVARLEEKVSGASKETHGPSLSLSFGAATALTVAEISDCFKLADMRMYNNKLNKKG